MREIGRGESDYPAALAELAHPPASLFAIGDPAILSAAPNGLVAIVGTRDASPYGVKVTSALAEAFAAAGIGVVSGLARGIDAAAHRAALQAGGKTVAVMGTGVDVPYPAAHRGLHAEIGARGVVISEQGPGVRAMPGCFPRRNRIIAALARVTIVVEAPYKSGAINTATQALDAGRVVAAVPGPIDSPRSAGANLLLRDGAQVVHAVADALMLYGLEVPRAGDRAAVDSLDAGVWDALAAGPVSVEALSDRCGLPVRQVLEGVARLELNGLARRQLNGSIERTKIA